MLKIIFGSLFLMCSTPMVYAQRHFDITIVLDESINPKHIKYQYYNGKADIMLPDTFGTRKKVVFKSVFYSPFASVNISYNNPTDGNYYSNSFFVNDKPALIRFHLTPNNQNKLTTSSVVNASPIFDGSVNQTYRALQAFEAKEDTALISFLNINPNFNKNDSIRRTFDRLYKAKLKRTMLFLKQNADDYFSFWYFRDQISKTTLLATDTGFIKEQLSFLRSAYPAKFTTSIEGKELIKTYTSFLNPLEINETAPPFTITTLDGKRISLNKLKGKYVLLDFWATWCGPCMAQMPLMREIRKNNSAGKLTIIGISWDRDSKMLASFVKKQGMNWPHHYDENMKTSHLYGVNAIPVVILINKEGKVVFKGDLGQQDKEKLFGMLKNLN
jgi:thiol-disulfide isomerase/thioredoxin